MTKWEKFKAWLNRFYHVQNKITICFLFSWIMIILGVVIYGAQQQKASANVTVTYSRPSYTVTFDPAGGGGIPSSKSVKLGDLYGDLPTPTRDEYIFSGWYSGSTQVTSSTQYTTIGNTTLYAKWDSPSSYLTSTWATRIGLTKSSVTSIVFTKDSSKIPSGYSSVSVGTNSSTSTDAYVTSDEIVDVTAYYNSDKTDIVIYSPKTIYAPALCSDLFYNYTTLTTLTLDNFNTSKVTTMSWMFANCSSLTSLNVTNFNTSNVTDMNYLFRNCSSLTNLNVRNFNTSKVATMSRMFYQCSGLSILDLSNFDTSKVTNMGSMFFYCTNLTSLNVRNFNTSNVTDMYGMFSNCSSLSSLNVTNFNTSKVTSMGSMFYRCSGLSSLDLRNFDTSKVESIGSMFYYCSGLTSLNLGNFNLTACKNFSSMLDSCSALTSITLPYNLGSSYTINLPASTFYNGSAGPYSSVGTATSGTTVTCSTASSKVTLTKK